MLQRPASLNFNHLRLFRAVAEHEGISRAAEAIGISQPAVSRAVKDLEREVGIPLIEHVGRRVVLTEAGLLLADYAARIFALSAEAQVALDALRGIEGGELAIAASTTIGVYLLPRLLGSFHQQYPGVSLSLDVGNTAHALDQLRRGSVDVALIEGGIDGDDLVVERCQVDELVLITSPSHPFARVGGIDPESLTHTPFLIRERGSGTRFVVEQSLAQRGVRLAVTIELSNTEAIKQAVMSELGVSIVSRLTIERERRDHTLAVINLHELTITRWLMIAWRRHYRPTAAAGAFLELLRHPAPPDYPGRPASSRS
jgi:DNA-binding transcriptional LysR family regulator